MELESIFNKTSRESLTEYLRLCSQYVADFNVEEAHNLTNYAIKYYRNSKTTREDLRKLHQLEMKWYQSLEKNNPDYTLYDDSSYLSDLWACWVVYSRKYLLLISSKKLLSGESIIEDIGDISSIADLGCGVGYTTAGIKELFPAAQVYGTNFKDSTQWKIATRVGELYNFKIVPDIIDKQIDMIFASEYFEHIENTIEHLENIIINCQPRILIIANAFGSSAFGHFEQYKYNGRFFSKQEVGKIFNKTLRARGYVKVKTNLWNDRPSYWKKQENCQSILI